MGRVGLMAPSCVWCKPFPQVKIYTRIGQSPGRDDTEATMDAEASVAAGGGGSMQISKALALGGRLGSRMPVPCVGLDNWETQRREHFGWTLDKWCGCSGPKLCLRAHGSKPGLFFAELGLVFKADVADGLPSSTRGSPIPKRLFVLG